MLVQYQHGKLRSQIQEISNLNDATNMESVINREGNAGSKESCFNAIANLLEDESG